MAQILYGLGPPVGGCRDRAPEWSTGLCSSRTAVRPITVTARRGTRLCRQAQYTGQLPVLSDSPAGSLRRWVHSSVRSELRWCRYAGLSSVAHITDSAQAELTDRDHLDSLMRSASNGLGRSRKPVLAARRERTEPVQQGQAWHYAQQAIVQLICSGAMTPRCMGDSGLALPAFPASLPSVF